MKLAWKKGQGLVEYTLIVLIIAIISIISFSFISKPIKEAPNSSLYKTLVGSFHSQSKG